MSKKEATKDDEEGTLLLIFAENAQAFTAAEGENYRTRLAQLLEAKRQSLVATPDLLDQYVVKLIHRCPNFLDGPVGFAWVEEHYKKLLQRVRIMPELSRRYWNKMLPEVKKSFVRRGRVQSPANRQRDIDQSMVVHIGMNKGMKKTAAVTNLINAGQRFELQIDQQEIFRALKRTAQQGAGTWQVLVGSPNNERNQKNAAAFRAVLMRQSNTETVTEDLSPKEKTLMRILSKGLEKHAQSDIGAGKINPKRGKRKK